MQNFEKIIARIKETQDDFFNESSDLLIYLPYIHAKEFLKENYTEEKWSKTVKRLNEEIVISEMKEYMPFALEKASNHRGLSASRSIEHFQNWLFLLGDDELLNFSQQGGNYTNYGCPILKKICQKYGFEYPSSLEMQRMAEGKPCVDNCEEGCGI